MLTTLRALAQNGHPMSLAELSVAVKVPKILCALSDDRAHVVYVDIVEAER